MRKIIVLLIFTSFNILFSQKNHTNYHTISGKILDADSNKPLEYATVIIKKSDSLTITSGAITNSSGQFHIDVKEGNYIISIEFLSYKTKTFDKLFVSKNTNLGTIPLEINTEVLNEINIKSEKKGIEMDGNKLIFNVERDLSAAGASAIQILGNIPSISVDPDGNISLRGQDNVAVMINGKTSSLSKADALKSIPAASIEKIEVITNPGAQYKASLNGVINIILKKGKDEGLNASITTSVGFKDYYGGLVTLNHKSKGVNFFTSTNYALSTPITISNANTSYFANDKTIASLNEMSEFKATRNGFNSTIGADLDLSENTTISPKFNYTRLHYKNVGNTQSYFYDASKTETANNDRDYVSYYDDDIYELIIDFEHNFKKEGRQLTSYIQLTRDGESTNNRINNSNLNFTNETYSQGFTIDNTIVDVSYTNPFGKFSTYIIGYGGEFGKFPFRYTGNFKHKDIDYSEDIHQAYFDYEYDNEKFYFNIGFRGEFQQSSLKYIDENTYFKTKVNDLFPSTSAKYQINEAHSLKIGVSTGIIRVTPIIMQPYEEKISETASYKGNEQIKPIYLSKVSFNHFYKTSKFSLSTDIFYDKYDDYWEYITYETGEVINGVNKILTTPFNINYLKHSGISLTTTYKVNNLLDFSTYVLINNFNEKGTFKTVNTANKEIIKTFNNDNITGSLSLMAQLKIPNVFNIQTNIKHQLKNESNYFSRKAYTYANAAINKDLFNGDASVSLQVDDIFKSNTINRNRFDTNYFSNSVIENKFRTIILSFTYRFNQSKRDRRIEFDKKDIKPNY